MPTMRDQLVRTILDAPFYSLPWINQAVGVLSRPYVIQAGDRIVLELSGPGFSPTDHNFDVTVLVHLSPHDRTQLLWPA